MKLFHSGLGWGLIEHKWERRTNWMIICGISVSIILYYIQFTETDKVAILFLVMIGCFHFIARLSHIVEKHKMKDFRPWIKK